MDCPAADYSGCCSRPGRYDLCASSHRELDLLDAAAVKRYLREGCFDAVLHTANANHVTRPELAPCILEYNLRLFGVFGKYEEWQRRFISNMICRNLTGQVMEMNQNMYFDYLYIYDLIRILEWFLTHEPRRHHYNVCSGQRFEPLSLARMVRQETGIPAGITIRQDGWKPEYTGNNDRMRSEMGDLRLTPIRTAIQEMIAYCRKEGFSPY